MAARLALRSRRIAALLVVASLTALVGASAALGLPPFTKGPKASPPVTVGQAQLAGIGYSCGLVYDRIVFRFTLGTPGYDVRYVAQVFKDPSGFPLALLGNKKLRIVFHNARAHTVAGGSLPVRTKFTPLCTNVRQVKQAGDFEGVLSWGVGLRDKAAFRVFRLTSPTRVVIDVLH